MVVFGCHRRYARPRRPRPRRRNGTPCPDAVVRQDVKLWGRRSYARTIDQEVSHEVPERAEETPKVLATVG